MTTMATTLAKAAGPSKAIEAAAGPIKAAAGPIEAATGPIEAATGPIGAVGVPESEGAAETAGRAARIEHVSKSFAAPGGPQLVLDDISLDVAPGEFVTLLGASG
ncbi:hypothetical protein ACWEVZ_38100, partial [Streptomyces spiralis]